MVSEVGPCCLAWMMRDRRRLCRIGNAEPEGRALPSSDSTQMHPPCRSMIFADSQADPGARILRSGVKPLENDEGRYRILGIDADPVVMPPKTATSLRAGRRYECAAAILHWNLMALLRRF